MVSFLVEHLSAGFSDHVILKDVSLRARQGEILGILGPAGVGKSTFLRTLSGWNDLLPSFWSNGKALLEGRNLLESPVSDPIYRRVPLLAQKKRLYTASVLENLLADLPVEQHVGDTESRADKAEEILAPFGLWDEMRPLLNEAVVTLPIGAQRRIAIIRMMAAGALFLLADEPLRDISDQEVAEVEGLLRKIKPRCGVLLVTHNLAVARRLCDRAALLVAGRVVESAPIERFFQTPESELTQRFVQTGNCWPSADDLQSPEWQTPVVDPPSDSSPTEQIPSLHWILKGRLGGMRMPGLLGSLEHDLERLKRLGCKALISLRYRQRIDPQQLSTYGIEGLHFPIADMGTPSYDTALSICRTLDRFLHRQQPVVLHCKAGLGRTGTVLATFLVYQRSTAVTAIESVRSVNAHFIQSQEQVEFIGSFERFLADKGMFSTASKGLRPGSNNFR